MRRFLLLMLIVLVLALIFGGCAGPQPGVVAKVGKYTITADDLNEKMGPARFKSFEDELEARRKRLEKMAEEKLILMAAYDKGLDKDPDVLQYVDRSKENILLNTLYQIEVAQKVGKIPEDEIKKFYERKKELLHAKHILVKSKELADSIYDMLKNGANFDELAKKYSEDRSNKDRGGDLGDFTTLSMVKEFEDAAYSLSPGEFSKPVETRYGWHIIYLVERKPNPRVKSFDEEKKGIERALERRRRSELTNEFIEGLMDDANVQLKDDAVKVILDAYGNANASTPGKKVEVNLTPEQRAMQLFTYKYGSWTVAQFDSFYKALPPFRRPDIKSREDIKSMIKNALRKELLLKKAEELKIDQTDDYKKEFQKTLERRMVDEYRKKYLYKDVEPTDEQVRAYYDANPDSFIQDEQVRVIEIQVDTEDEAKKLLDRINKGEDIGKLAAQYTKRTYVKAKNGDLGFFTEKRYPELFRAAKTLKPGEVYPKPIPFQGKFSIIKLTEAKPPERKPFESVKRIIKRKLRTKMRNEAYQKWIEEAKRKYGYKIFESELEKTIDKSKYEQKQPA